MTFAKACRVVCWKITLNCNVFYLNNIMSSTIEVEIAIVDGSLETTFDKNVTQDYF